MDLDELVDRAKQGLVRRSELAEVAAQLRYTEDETRAYRLLYVLARSTATEHEELVASFLSAGDPELARLALQTLCTFWGRTESYVDFVRAFLAGVSWDSGDVRQIAISVAGEHLRTHTDTGMLARLLELAYQENHDEVERRVALEALATALGDPVAETLRAGGDDRAGWTARVLARAEERLAAE